MLGLKKVAVTGGIAAGKSTVCRLLEELGAYVLSADDIVHDLLAPTTDLGTEVICLLGQDVVVNDKFDRNQIAKKVFNDPTLLFRLEQLIHPKVHKVIEKRYRDVSQGPQKYSLFVVEFPLLFENHHEKFYDFVIVVGANEKISKERFYARKNNEENDFEKRTNRLIPLKEKIKHADFVIINEHGLHELKQEVQRIYKQIQELSD